MKKGTFFAVLVLMACIVGGFAINGDLKSNRVQDKKALFLKCSKDQGDWGCDSCWFKVYGYYPSHEKIYGGK